MILSVSRLALAVGLCYVVSCSGLAEDASVSKLGSDDFSTFIADNKLALVNFCVPGERKCKKLSYVWEIVAKGSADDTLKFASVDCEKSKDICDKHKVTSYPTVLSFVSGVASDVVSPLKKSVIIALAEELKKPPPAKSLQTEADVTSFQENGLNVIAFTDTSDDDCFDVFEAVAANPPLPANFAVAPVDVLSKVWDGPKSKSGPTILLKAPFLNKAVAFTDTSCSIDALNAFIKAESFPVFGPIANTNYHQYMSRGLPIVWCFLENNDQQKEYIASLEKAAEGTKGKLSWVHLDADAFGQHASSLGLPGDKWPGVVIDNQKERKKYIFPSETEFTSNKLAEFASKVLSGEVSPTLKSQDIPADDAPLKTVVGKSYDNIVIKSDDDVFLMVHAHWCGHCQRAMPRVNDLAQLFAKVDSVVVAAIDADLNDVPIEYQGFPTIYFLAAGRKDKPIPFNGQRTIEAFAGFILDHATKTVSAADKRSILDKAKQADELLDNPKTETQSSGNDDEKEEL